MNCYKLKWFNVHNNPQEQVEHVKAATAQDAWFIMEKEIQNRGHSNYVKPTSIHQIEACTEHIECPTGVKSEAIVRKEKSDELLASINRYNAAGMEVPIQWIIEFLTLNYDKWKYNGK